MPPAEVTAPTPASIFEALEGFHLTAALKTAIELDLFSHIAAGADTVATLAAAANASERGVSVLADALVVTGFLQKDGSRYRLSPDAAAFLDRRSPAFMGTIAEFLTSPFTMEAFGQLTTAVRQGGTALADHPSLQPNSPAWLSFARNMAALARPGAHALAELLLPRPGGRCKVLDVAAGHGLFGIAMAQRNPEAEIYALDWPQVLTIAQENAAAAGVADRLHLIPGNAFEADWGSDYDWVLLPNVLHLFDAAGAEQLLAKARAALGPDGEAAIVEFLVDDTRTQPPVAALFGLTMLAVTPHGGTFTLAEMQALAERAGFSETESHPLPFSQQRVVIATP